MAITARYTQKQFKDVLNGVLVVAEKKIEAGLVEIGVQFVADAKANGQYMNDTGNLRSSIGYIVSKGRKIISSGFNTVQGGNVGKTKGFFLAKSMLKDNKERALRLIVVAGMEYASILESKGRDVLTGSSSKAINDLKSLVNRVKNGNK
jgi:hypothetical protein